MTMTQSIVVQFGYSAFWHCHVNDCVVALRRATTQYIITYYLKRDWNVISLVSLMLVT